MLNESSQSPAGAPLAFASTSSPPHLMLAVLIIPWIGAYYLIEHAFSGDRIQATTSAPSAPREILRTHTKISGASGRKVTETCNTRVKRGSHLFALPAELRNTIYELALPSNDGLRITIPPSGHLPRPALLKVCKQITAEASCIYYSINTFYSTMSPAPLNVFI
ncbi:hypothetical protein EJ03DRAFT_351021 [Teratosphaeria nubilosa]|uniref:Uncharacterized protein n=1 Tax=Teratosphaeria nubilosa TaxID=161662 RepID=A0A6G1LAT6_9PEZI|nr:hypothetical protein EJ03DRAFT_351021 [Teratosphaeria nubilosa]